MFAIRTHGDWLSGIGDEGEIQTTEDPKAALRWTRSGVAWQFIRDHMLSCDPYVGVVELSGYLRPETARLER